MKLKSLLSLLTLVVLISAFTGYQDTKGVARVQKILGKEVYVLSEPLREYDMVEDMTTGMTTALAGRSTIQKQMEEVIKRGLNKVEKGKISGFDAALTTDGDRIVLIKFKD
jgi:hypothetical protein